MGLFSAFRKKKQEAGYSRPDWMRDGMAVSLFGGIADLHVVGESYYQDELWHVVGGRSRNRVRQEVAALLVAETDNQYDASAISVWVGGFKVGHLSREDAARMRSGLLALEREEGKKVALEGVIAGGGERSDGIGMLGVFLNYDPEDFGLASDVPATPQRSVGGAGLRTGLSEASMTDHEDDFYDLGWLDDLSENPLKAIKQLRELIEGESDPIGLHFMHSELERLLYKSRDAFGSALDEYDETCVEHDAAMVRIRPALFEKFGAVPFLETYKQQAIRQQKAKDFERGSWWVQRGIDLYSDDAADEAWVQDLRTRLQKFQVRLEGSTASGGGEYETLVCHTCGTEFERKRTRGRKPHECPECRDA